MHKTHNVRITDIRTVHNFLSYPCKVFVLSHDNDMMIYTEAC